MHAGLLASVSPWFIVSLVLLFADVLAELIRPQPRVWPFGLFLVGRDLWHYDGSILRLQHGFAAFPHGGAHGRQAPRLA